MMMEMVEKEEDDAMVRWAVNTSLWRPTDQEFHSCLALLPPPEWPSVHRYRSMEDRKRAIVSRLLQYKLMHLLLGIKYEEICISHTPQGKPYLVNKVGSGKIPNLSFNVSHHGQYVVLVTDPVSPVGVDITSSSTSYDEPPEEYFKSFTSYFTLFEWNTIWSAGPEASALYEQFHSFSHAGLVYNCMRGEDCMEKIIRIAVEYIALQPKSPQNLSFLAHRHWSMKEAYGKAMGVGMDFKMQQAEFHYQNGLWGDSAHVHIDGVYAAGWQFWLHKLDGNHWVCVAVGPPGDPRMSFHNATSQIRNQTFRILTMGEVLSGMTHCWQLPV